MAEAGADVAGCCGWWLFMHPDPNLRAKSPFEGLFIYSSLASCCIIREF